MRLTPRQAETLCYVANGLTLVEAARLMLISSSATRTYMSAVKRKLQGKTAARCVVIAIHRGILVFDEDGTVVLRGKKNV